MSQAAGLGGRAVPAEDRRALLLDTAEGVFRRLGYEATTVAALASAAGVTRPTVYSYFDSKDAVFRALVDRVRAEFLRLQERTPSGSPATMVREIVAGYLRAYTRHDGLLTILAHQALADPALREVHDEVFARAERRNTRFLERLADDGVARPVVPPDRISVAITGLIARFARLAAAEPDRLEALAGEVSDMYLCLAGIADPPD
ncbi:Transcriptional regulator, TetR family [Pseudonocardia sp. Ae168_Ps1]|uniref:TetR/AcrR family transcriptional regulator n=1 Tax=unclassified Pseudonocardia TaxID=2619320 RepID=UPI0007066FB2|nr:MULTISPECIES: TetR/AcrR family transcriptional regulator [unclassified Pseudonocardia]ALL76015.1 hypothetical protein AD006_13185 [Pseudonocardia sp. EC080610-09]ALL83043.1 hypothetical protein AD017_21020 [Pseudonocardia sp. EC080619-01]OLL73290.1 Transcriptional regulator, TetR family [Pseudonocardia sp. Ae150A_Ps1]OLL79269.1 Transcriptional regulator, TetR family [Pseudonocardia sp. Ae168_Ps1]OLL86593.1 Transcriptional regulator, TetR family [Pseudonocardia sp. Ae263_Ps1]